MKTKTKLYIGIVILTACFFFIGKAFIANLQNIDFHSLRFNFFFLLISYILWLFALLEGVFAWEYTMLYLGEKLSFLQALKIISLAALPKYIPGKVFGIASQIWLTKEEGKISGGKSGIGAILNMIVSILGGTILGCIILPFVLKDKLPINIYFLLGVIPILFVMLYPPVFLSVFNWFLKIFKRGKITLTLTYNQILKLLFLQVVFWVLQSIAMFFLIRSFYLIRPSFLIPLCGIFSGASVIGLVSFFTPGGLGVREGILSYLFSFFMPTSIGIVISIIMRLWGAIGELVFFLIFAKSIKKYVS
ncbi:MAG: lysylphosphatidylglycerol synthase domain-containing protein [bacterium]|nr:lysylphosphatidylglycerol synthase domain-containing protein [bacterium]